MQYIESTIEIIASKVLNHNIDKKWIDWAVNMLSSGIDFENLSILAGESEPYNQFYLQSLTDKILVELQIDISDKETIINNYISYLIKKALKGNLDHFKVLRILKDLCIELNYPSYLSDFYSLFFAKDDLLYSEHQWYWEGATKENIDNIITLNFESWIKKQKTNA
jgi:hypothetical protein